MRSNAFVSAWAAGMVLASLASAQLPQEQIHAAGLGAQVQVIDAGAVTGDGLLLGVAALKGEIYVTGAGTTPTVYVLDSQGALVRTFPQLATSTFAWRDGATDGESLMFGWEAGIDVVDAQGVPVQTVQAANGPQTLSANPIAGPGLAAIGNYRAVAYDPTGNGGNGSIWTASFGSDLLEIDLDGNILQQFPNTGGWSIYGLAWDPHMGVLLANSIPNAGDIGVIHPSSGTVTGISFPRNQVGSAQGGLSVVYEPSHPGGGRFDVIGLDQAASDTITRYRIHLHTHPLRSGYKEARLLTGFNGGPLDDSPIKPMTPGGTIAWEVRSDSDPVLERARTFVLMNAGPDALVNGTPVRGLNVPEFVALTHFTMPPGTPVTWKTFTDEPLEIPTPMGLANGDLIRIQAVTVNPSGLAAFTATNQLFFEYDATRIVVTASGSNSFNSNTTSGFFRVEHRFGSPIASVEFDWVNSSNPAQSTMRFDTNQTGMADVFDAGDSTVGGCQGTYRNGSDASTGLVYDAANTAPTSSCAVSAGANTGWIGANMGTTGDYRTLTFRFAPGQFTSRTFEFDVDTDGGAGIAGDDMAGMVVTIVLEDGSMLNGELAVDPSTANQSVLKFF